MNTTKILENWNETKIKLKEKFAILTDSDLLIQNGQKDELEGRLQKKLGKSKEEWHKIIEAL